MAFQTGLGKGRREAEADGEKDEPTIYCRGCKKDLPESKFEPQKRNSKVATCSRCRREQMYAKVNSSVAAYLTKLHSSLSHNRKKQGFDWDVTVDDFVDIYESQEGRCALSGVVLTHYRDGGGAKSFNCSVDRINPQLGYTRKNIQIVAYSVNILKGTMDEYEFMWWINNIYRRKVKGEKINAGTE